MVTVRQRVHGARATAGPNGLPEVVSASGAAVQAATAPSAVGFSPLDLLHASLASCLAISAQMAARELGLAETLTRIGVEVSGEKAGDAPSRLAAFHVRFELDGLAEADRRRVVERAEQLCTVSNTLRAAPVIEIRSFAGSAAPRRD